MGSQWEEETKITVCSHEEARQRTLLSQERLFLARRREAGTGAFAEGRVPFWEARELWGTVWVGNTAVPTFGNAICLESGG